MQLNVNDQIGNDNLIVNGQPIAIADHFKYLGSYLCLTNKDTEARIGLIWSKFAKLILSHREIKVVWQQAWSNSTRNSGTNFNIVGVYVTLYRLYMVKVVSWSMYRSMYR